VKQRYGGHVIAISLGSLDSQNALSETLAIGADRAVLLHDDLFEGADAHATVTVLEAAVTRILDYDLILCGACSDDLSEFQVGPRLAEVCNLPIITYAKKISLEGRNVVVERELEHERQTVEARLPCLITMLSDDGLDRRFEKITVSASNKRIEIWDAADLNLSDHEVGFSGSLVEVLRSREYPPDRTARMLTGNVEELVPKVVETLKREGALRLE
jgi:electron transfer flavoprotein beta subunit